MQPDWKTHILNTDEQIRALLQRTKTIAVLGIKPETHSDQPGFYVAAFAQSCGYKIIPVPVYYPNVTEILGEPVVRSMSDIALPIDMINVFRKSGDIPAHVDDLRALKPSSVWMQLGIAHEESAERLARAGIDVVQDRCLLVELRRLLSVKSQ